MTNFTRCKLKDVLGKKGYIRGPFGSALRRAEMQSSGIPVYEQTHAIDDVRTFRYFISDEKFEKLKRFQVEPKDLIISCSGTVGQISIITEEDPLGIISQALLILRPDDQKILPKYLYYFLSSKQGHQKLTSVSHGTVQVNIAKRADVENIELLLPPITEQQRILDILTSLDDKIALNRRTNATLEALAQALFRAWFVDYEPVRAKLAAKRLSRDPERVAMAAIGGKLRVPRDAEARLTVEDLDAALAELDQLTEAQRAELARTADLFPGAFVDSELGEVPEGWVVKASGEVYEATRGFSYKGKGLSDSGMPLHNLNSVLEGGGYKYAGIKYYILDTKEKHRIHPGELVITNTEQGFKHMLIGYPALIPTSFQEGVFSHHLYRIKPKENYRNTELFFYYLFHVGPHHLRVVGYSNGTTVNMLPKDALTRPLLILPSIVLVHTFMEKVAATRKWEDNVRGQNENLHKIRQELLSYLLSG